MVQIRSDQSLSRVRLFMTAWTAAYQAPPSMGFSRQEYWSGLPFPSPMHESEKWKWSRSVMSHSSRPHGLQPTRLLRPWDFPGQSTGVGCRRLLLLCMSRTLRMAMGHHERDRYMLAKWQQLLYRSLSHRAYQKVFDFLQYIFIMMDLATKFIANI